MNTQPTNSSRRTGHSGRFPFAIAAFMGLTLGAVHATPFYWDADGAASGATGGSGAWDTTSLLWRPGSSTGTPLSVWPVSGMDNDAFLEGTAGTLTLGPGIRVNDISVTPTVASTYTIAGTQRLTLIGVLPTLSVASGSNLAINAPLDGAVGILKSGAGTLILDNASNTFVGGVTLSAGTLQIGSSIASTTATQASRYNTVNLSTGATLTAAVSSGNPDLRVGRLNGSGGAVTLGAGALNLFTPGGNGTYSGSITTTGGINLRGITATQTFNGDVTGLTGTVGVNSTMGLTLSGTGSTNGVLGSALLATRGGTITLDNSGGNTSAGAGRIADAAALTFLGGKFELIGHSGGTAETVGVYTMNVGQNTVSVNNGGGTGTALTLASFARTSGNAGTVNFVGAGTGTLGSAGNNPRVIFSTAPGLTNNVIANSAASGILGFATVNGTDFAGYGANGVVAVSSTALSGALATAASQNSVLTANGATIAGSDVSYNTLKLAPTSSGFTLDLTGAGALNTAGILLAGNNDFTIRNTGGGTGGLSAGNQRFVNVANAGTTLSVGVSLLSSNNALTKSGDGILALTGTASQVGGTAATKYGIAGGVFRGSLTSLGGGAAAGGAFTTIQLRGGVLEVSGGGTFTRAIDLTSTASGGSVTFDEGGTDRGDGGFSAINGEAVVTLVTAIGGSTAASLVWNDGAFLSNGYALTMGSTKSDSIVVLTNNIGLDASAGNYFGREVRVADNTGSTGDASRLSGVISGSVNADLIKSGAGVLQVTGTNTYSGNTHVSEGTLQVGASGGTGAANGRLANTAVISVSGITTVSPTGGTLLLGGTNASSDRINDSASLRLLGGTFDLNDLSEVGTGPLSASTNGLGLLILASANPSTLDFGTLGGGSNTVQFGGVGGQLGVLQINDYAAGSDHLYFSGVSSDFNELYDQSEVSFNGGLGYAAVSFSGYYEIVPVPEPATIFGALALLGFVGFRERRHFMTFLSHFAPRVRA